MDSKIEEILKLKTINKLKFVSRRNSVGERKESPAEHSWSCLILADYFLDKIEQKLDKLKVYDLLIYHDIVEIESGNIPIDSKDYIRDNTKKEALAAKALEKKLPFNISNKFSEIFREYQSQKTIESKFAKAVNVLDPIILGLDHKSKWRGLSREFLYRHKEETLKEFPIMHEYFHALMNYCEAEGYFNQ